MKHFSYLILTLVFSVLTACSSDDNNLESTNYLDARTFFEELNYNGTVIISKNGTDILRDGFGNANKELQLQNTINTKFRLASVTKTITSMAIVQLKRDGYITSFDQTLNQFDSTFPNGNQISIRHMLKHESGLPDYLPSHLESISNGETFDAEDIYDNIKISVLENGLEFTPGIGTQYSNSNFLIAALLVEELTNMSFDDYISQNILQPLNMNATEAGTNNITGNNYAQGYHNNSNASFHPINLAFGAGHLTSTALDMEKWCYAVMGNDWFTIQEKEAIFDTPNISEGVTAFGMGWFKSIIDGKEFYWHGGDIDGFTTLIGFVPSSNSIIITLSNEQDDSGITRNNIISTIVKEEL